MNLEKVIFDTNIIRNIEPSTFLGGRDELKKFAKVSELIFPDMVIDEMKQQKIRQLEQHKSKFLSNPFHWLKGLDKDETKNFDNIEHIKELEKNEEIKYSIIELSDYSVLKNMKELALKKEAPFENKKDTDKGFKDTYIYFTILEYLENIDDEYVFVYTGDGRLKDAFNNHHNIKIILSYNDFEDKSVMFFYNNDYFIEKLKENISENITKKDILDFWLGFNGNKFLLINVSNIEYIIEVDFSSNEIISQATNLEGNNLYRLKKEVLDYKINSFINSGSFSSTHTAVSEFSGFEKFLSDKDIINVLEAAISNSQIIYDRDVKQFINNIFEPIKDILEQELKESIEELLNF